MPDRNNFAPDVLIVGAGPAGALLTAFLTSCGVAGLGTRGSIQYNIDDVGTAEIFSAIALIDLRREVG